MTDRDDAERAAQSMAQAIAGMITNLGDMDPSEERTTTIRLFAARGIDGGEPHVAISGVPGIPTEEHHRMERQVMDRVDLRKAPRAESARRARGKSVEVGSITYNGEGEILETDLNAEYLKPSEREGEDGVE